MSITSSDNQKLHPDFADLLARYAGLAGWLSNALYSGKEWQAEDLLSRFLAECADQGIPETAYPFTASDQGLADLQVYLQSASKELDAFHFTILSGQHETQPPASTSASSAQGEERVLGDAPTDKIPVIKLAANEKQTTEAD